MSEEKTFTHFSESGGARMVDVSGKDRTARRAKATGRIAMSREAMDALKNGRNPKGDVLAVARIAGVMAAKKTADLIPLCHPLAMDFCEVTFNISESHMDISAEVRCFGATGVEMEALTAVSAAALTVYDMCKSFDRGMVITGIKLMEKEGGKSGRYER